MRSCVQWVLSQKAQGWFTSELREETYEPLPLSPSIRLLLEQWLDARAESDTSLRALGALKMTIAEWDACMCTHQDITNLLPAALAERGSTARALRLVEAFQARGGPDVDAMSSVQWVLSEAAGYQIIGGTFRRDLPGPAYDKVVIPLFVAPSVRAVLERWLAREPDEHGHLPTFLEEGEIDDAEEFQWTVEHLVSLGWTPEEAARRVDVHEMNVAANRRSARR